MCMSTKYKCKCQHANDDSCLVFISLPKLKQNALFHFFFNLFVFELQYKAQKISL
jgi:hypothetical protein